MSNHLSSLLEAWRKAKSETNWVLGTVYKTEGSTYRKAGSLMLVNGLGQRFGLLSGGCLEADIVRNARKVMTTRRPLTLTYDGSDEDDMSFQLGIGCGGTVHIMLQPIGSENDLGLQDMADALARRVPGIYRQRIGGLESRFNIAGERSLPIHGAVEGDWLITPIVPEPHLLVVGGGSDAKPLVGIAKNLGWRVTLADPRAANARIEHFPAADVIWKQRVAGLGDYALDARADMAVLMSHSLSIDADALSSLQSSLVKHIALLGPRQRYRQVLERAGLEERNLSCPVSGPAGLDIGGQLPESVALSILAECHAVLHGRKHGRAARSRNTPGQPIS